MHRIFRGLAVLVAFGGVYTLLVAALTYLNAVGLGLVGRTYADAPWQGWLEYYWPFFALAYAPAAVAALLSAWYSKLPIGGMAAFLGATLASILLVMGLDYGSWNVGKPTQIVQGLLLGGAFFFVARAYRRRTLLRH
jgi:hypothetical protein